ncbi:MAG: hypothetical protein ACRD68_11750 [Pyrinomonadaceae bacterium]
MVNTDSNTTGARGAHHPPPLRRDAEERIEPSSLADMIQWFLDYDERVAVVKYPAVEALFQWKQQETLRDAPGAFAFGRAEDRLAVGIMQALTANGRERELHAWIKELLGALDEATKTNEEISGAYNLRPDEGTSVVAEAEKIPTRRERDIYLTCCWLEILCTAEIRVLGWAYQELYGRPFRPETF